MHVCWYLTCETVPWVNMTQSSLVEVCYLLLRKVILLVYANIFFIVNNYLFANLSLAFLWYMPGCLTKETCVASTFIPVKYVFGEIWISYYLHVYDIGIVLMSVFSLRQIFINKKIKIQCAGQAQMGCEGQTPSSHSMKEGIWSCKNLWY